MSSKVYTKLEEATLNDLKGKKVTIIGKTINLHLGAMVKTEGYSIWIENLDCWPNGYYLGEDKCKTVRITGKIIQKSDLPVFLYKEGDPIRSGIPVPEGTDLKKAKRRFLLRNADWEVIEE